MKKTSGPKYYLVEAGAVPDILVKVVETKRLVETGEAPNVAKAVALSGISRSAYYKYKDSVSLFADAEYSRMVTFHIMLHDSPGVLSGVLAIFAGIGANILTINQSIPINGVASVTISASVAGSVAGIDELMAQTGSLAGVVKIEIVGSA